MLLSLPEEEAARLTVTGRSPRMRPAGQSARHAAAGCQTLRDARDVTFDIAPKLESEALPTIPTPKMFDPNGGIAALPPDKRIDEVRATIPNSRVACGSRSGSSRRVS